MSPVYRWAAFEASLSRPAEARTLRLSCHAANVLVSGYTRPPGLERRVRVSEDYDPSDLDPRRTWFFLRQANAAEWHELARQVLVPPATRDSPSPARFVRVPAGEDRRLFWGTVPGPLTVRPRLRCLRTTPEPDWRLSTSVSTGA